MVAGVKITVRGPALCPSEEWGLRHSPSVVAGSSSDCDCTGNKGQCLMYCTQQAAVPAMSPHRGVSPSTPCGFNATLAMYPMKTSTRKPAKEIIPSRCRLPIPKGDGIDKYPNKALVEICQTTSVTARCRPKSRTH